MTDEDSSRENAARVRTLVDLAARVRADPGRATPAPLETSAGSLESFTAVIDALAAELETPRAEIIRSMIEDLRRRIALDRAVLAHLLQLEDSDRSAERGADREM